MGQNDLFDLRASHDRCRGNWSLVDPLLHSRYDVSMSDLRILMDRDKIRSDGKLAI